MQLDVFALPAFLPERCDYDFGIAIDVLRATSVIAAALASGANQVVPFLDVDVTLRAKSDYLTKHQGDSSRLVLGGERKGIRIDGFDLGNSPAEYTKEAIGGKDLFFSTTNGTKAILSGAARTMATASFLNMTAVVRFLAERDEHARIAIVCAGTGGSQTTEDLLLAGALVQQLVEYRENILRREPILFNITAETVRQMWREVLRSFFDLRPQRRRELHTHTFYRHLESILRESPGGRNLIAIGLDSDIADVCQLDAFDIVPTLRDGALVLASSRV